MVFTSYTGRATTTEMENMLTTATYLQKLFLIFKGKKLTSVIIDEGGEFTAAEIKKPEATPKDPNFTWLQCSTKDKIKILKKNEKAKLQKLPKDFKNTNPPKK